MWILTCTDDALQGRQIWLRPGKTYLFGRTKPEGTGHGFEISHRSVSRKHLVITVSHMRPDDGGEHGQRSHLTLRDENTKVGTVVDGKRLRNEMVTLQGNSHSFRLGSMETCFQLAWMPVVLSFTFPSKDTRGGRDPLVPFRGRLEELDIVPMLPYDREQTTHVVASKRNTAKCLQALINGRFVVDHSFIDSIIYAATPRNLDEPESLSPLEEDFEKHWPSPMDHIPAASKDLSQRPPDLFAPDPDRQTIFEGYTFIFCDERQFENLMPPITNGGGKALYLQVDHNSTTASHITSYYREISSQKGGDFSSDEGHVLIVRFAGVKGHESWATSVQMEVQSILGVELIEQNEFLDSVLTKDPSKLSRGFKAPEPTGANIQSQLSDVGVEGIKSANSGPPRTNRLRGTVRSAFTGFDDGFEDFRKQSKLDFANPSAPPNPRKRSPPSDEEDAKREDALLPAAAAMKRRRLEGGVPKKSPPVEVDITNNPQRRVKKEQKEINLMEAAREHRMAEDEAARHEELALQQSMSDMSFEQMNALAKIGEMNVKDNKTGGKDANRANSAADRWDPRWNGRKNFKKFRRQGEKQDLRRGQTVIVSLEEVKKRGQGIGEQYWLESTSSRRQRARDESEQGNQEDAISQSHQTVASAQSQQEQEIPRELADLNDNNTIDVDEPRILRHQEHAPTNRSISAAGSKRQAQLSKDGSVQKRQKTLASRGEESESEDELKFRFRRRKTPSTIS